MSAKISALPQATSVGLTDIVPIIQGGVNKEATAGLIAAAGMTINVKNLGAIGDGNSHPLSASFATLAAAQAVYPHATSLTNELDWAAIQGALNSGAASIYIPAGTYLHNMTFTIPAKGMQVNGEFAYDVRGLPNTVVGTHIIRTAEVVGWSAIGTSVLVGWVPVRRFNCNHINFDGGWAFSNISETYPLFDMRVCYEWYWNDCELTNTLGSAMQMQEVWDSRFNNCRGTDIGNISGTKAGIAMLSGSYSPGYETCNNIVFDGWRFESSPGVNVSVLGNNAVDIWFTDCKWENVAYQLDFLVQIVGATGVTFTNCWAFVNPTTYKNTSWTNTTTGKAMAVGADTFTIATGLTFNSGNYNLNQVRTNMSLLIYDATDPRNYMLSRLTNYTSGTGVITVTNNYVFGNTGKSITNWVIAPIHPGLIQIGGNSRLIRGNIMGGTASSAAAPSAESFLSTFIHIDGAQAVDIAMDIVDGYDMLPQSTFLGHLSTTSLAIGTGSQTFTIPAGLLDPVVGSPVFINGTDTAHANYWMIGTVTSYNSGTGALVCNITSTQGSGTLASWNIAFRLQSAFLETGTNADLRLSTRNQSFPATASVLGGLPILSNPSKANGSSRIDNIVSIPSAQFALLTPLAKLLYILPDTGQIYLGSTLVTSVTATQVKTWNIVGTLATGNDLTNWIIMPKAGTISKALAAVKTGPTGQPLIFDIQKSTNNGVTFTSLWASNPSNKIQVAAGLMTGSTTSFDTTTFNAGDILRIDIDQIGSGSPGANATVELVTTY